MRSSLFPSTIVDQTYFSQDNRINWVLKRNQKYLAVTFVHWFFKTDGLKTECLFYYYLIFYFYSSLKTEFFFNYYFFKFLIIFYFYPSLKTGFFLKI